VAPQALVLREYLQEKETELLSTPALFSELASSSLLALSSLCKEGGPALLFLSFFFLSFSRLALELFGIFDLDI
jgi:hypothetical protein